MIRQLQLLEARIETNESDQLTFTALAVRKSWIKPGIVIPIKGMKFVVTETGWLKSCPRVLAIKAKNIALLSTQAG